MEPNEVMEDSDEVIEVGYNKDILKLIFIRLPPKELIKFKFVSKTWHCIISDPRFCFCHTRHLQRYGFLEPTALLYKVDYITSPAFDVVPLNNNTIDQFPFFDHFFPNISLLQSCNGLLLCQSGDGDNEPRYFICNPTTKKIKTLSFPRYPDKDGQFSVNLAFDPLKSPDGYKIISILEVSKAPYVFEMDIYWSETDSWTETVTSFEADAIVFEEAVFCNGKIHWNSYGDKSRYFDVEEEDLQEMPMPERNGENDFFRYLGEARGTLYHARHGFKSLEVDVYEMASNYSNWYLKRRLNLEDAVVDIIPPLDLDVNNYGAGFSGVCFIRSQEEQEPRVVVWTDGTIICYDFNDGNWKRVYDPEPGLKIGSPNVQVFAEPVPDRFFAYKYFENLSCI